MTTKTSGAVSDQQSASDDRAPLRRVVIVALLIVAAASAVAQFVAGGVIPPEMGFLLGALIGAGVMATPWRWSMTVPLVVSVLLIVGPLGTGFPQYALSHPTDRNAFATLVIQYGMLTLTAGVCLVLLLREIRDSTGEISMWTRLGVAAVAGLTLGALLIGLIAQPEGATASTVGTQTVHLTASAFAPNIVALHKGDTLTLVGDSPTPHILANGAWSEDSHPAPGAETGAPTVDNVQVNDDTKTIGPFTTPGTYHIYCTIHPGMTLTISVV
jgi:plastocyanin